MCWTDALLLIACLVPSAVNSPATANTPHESQPVGAGRVIATVTTLEGTVQMAGVEVELRGVADGLVIAKTTTDSAGQVVIPDVPPGRYVIRGTRRGFDASESSPFDVRAGQSSQVLLDIPLTFVMPDVEVRAATPSPTDSVQPVSMSDMLSGNVLELAPLEGDDFHSLLPLLPGVVRGPDGRLRIKGGQPTQSALQISSASLVDPSSGDWDLELPGQSVESVEVLANPFAAEYGRFTTSITQIRTRRGTNEWEIKPGNLIPRIRKSFNGLRSFEPRFTIRGPIKHDRAFFSQDFQFRYNTAPVKSLPDEPEIVVRSFDSFTRVDTVLSSRHTLGGGVIIFPREIENPTMNTFRPSGVTPEFNQSGLSTGVVDRFALAPHIVLETTLSGRWFEINVNTKTAAPMVYQPQTQSGSFFNDQEREVGSLQWVEALSFSRDNWAGQHVFKVGVDVQHSSFTGFSESLPLEMRRLDGSLVERTIFNGRTLQDVAGSDVAVFAQDRWRMSSRVTFELGFRVDRDAIVQRANYSPRAGVAVGILPEGRGILRGGYGKFVQRTPLNVEAFPQFESRTVQRFGVNGQPLAPAITYLNRLDAGLRTPEAQVGNIEWNQRFGRRFLLKTEFLRRSGEHEFILEPDSQNGVMHLRSTGESRYREFEATTRYLGGERKDLTFSYTWSRGQADLNNYDQFYGNFRNPIIRPNEFSYSPTDVRHRVIVRGTIGLGSKWDLAPVLELRSGFPWSAVDEAQDFVGTRNRAGRLPSVHTLDFAISRPWRFKKYRFRGGLKFYNIFGASAQRDVQNNIASPEFGQFFNPIERSIGFVLGSAK